MSFSGFSEVEINRYESSVKKKAPLPKSTSNPRKSIKHTPLIEEEYEEMNKNGFMKEEEPGNKRTAQPLIPPVAEEEEIENKEIPLEDPDHFLTNNTIEAEELKHLPKPLCALDPQEIEDRNKKLKAIIEYAVKQRKEKSVQESEKLKNIQVELAKLDELVGNDVKIIRKDIEAVTQQLSESRKRYDRSEKEYVDAKIELHRHEERKNNLTDYLCFIITENETRKSEKLHELMKELNF